jgi:hypothetical protein
MKPAFLKLVCVCVVMQVLKCTYTGKSGRGGGREGGARGQQGREEEARGWMKGEEEEEEEETG